MPDQGSVGGGETMRLALMQRRLWLVGKDGSKPRQLTPDEAFRDEAPHWSGDGKHILFARVDDMNQASLWLAATDGSAPEPVTNLDAPDDNWFGYYGWLDWSRVFAFQPVR